jgi:glycosyltransferase involved in cell wall biosynthesis
VRAIRVGFDDQVFVAQRRGGFSKYFVELIKRLPDHGVEPVLLPRKTLNLHLSESGLVPAATEPSRVVATAEWVSWRALGRPRSQARTLPPFDVLHHTFTHPSYLGLWKGPRVLTVVDMTPELFPHFLRWGNPHFAKRRFAETVDAIVSISHNTTDDLARLYGEHLREKTTTIHFGIGEEYLAPALPNSLTLPARYVLFVGLRSGYKDFATAVRAVAMVKERAQFADLHFVVAGGGTFTDAERHLLADHGLESATAHVRPDDAQMPELYRRAAAFVFPSHYEGFGMPTLEALGSGTPTVLADASCSKEIGGDKALYSPVGDAAGFATLLSDAIENDSEDARQRRREYAKTFTWDATAAAHASLYRRLAGRDD